MVETQIIARGIRNPAVVQAMQSVPREVFVAPEMQGFAYEDTALPIAAGQTISQPYIVALMIAALQPQPEDRVLEIGTGSGYAAAVLSRVVREVYTVERQGELVEPARQRMYALGYDNIYLLHGDGTLGWPEHAPYDGIVVTAGGPQIPAALQQQLALHGHLVIPVGAEHAQQYLMRLTRDSDTAYRQETLGGVHFVPLIGAQGWSQRQGLKQHAKAAPR
jgi:protein-L-isoaspartate(D-aspartate) O-methyltransferase